MQYVWIIWSLSILGLWAVILFIKKDYREIMLPVSLVTMLFGLTEPLFVPEYWSPPTLFNLAERTGFDIESFIFSFAIGGLGTILYGLVFPFEAIRVNKTERKNKRHRYHKYILILPAAIFPLLSISTNLNPIYWGIITLFVSAVATLYCRPDLKWKIWIGGLLFAIFYFFYFGSVLIFYPKYVVSYWNLGDLSNLFILGVPIEEILFGFTFGMYWSSVYEHFGWHALKTKN